MNFRYLYIFKSTTYVDESCIKLLIIFENSNKVYSRKTKKTSKMSKNYFGKNVITLRLCFTQL